MRSQDGHKKPYKESSKVFLKDFNIPPSSWTSSAQEHLILHGLYRTVGLHLETKQNREYGQPSRNEKKAQRKKKEQTKERLNINISFDRCVCVCMGEGGRWGRGGALKVLKASMKSINHRT